MGILDDMKSQIASSGGGAKGFFGLRDGEKKKVRFLDEMDNAVKILIHDKWGEYSVLCQDHLGLECSWCSNDDDEQADKEFFLWQVYSYDAKAVELFVFRANENAPVPRMLEYFEVYGTIVDRDYTVARTGTRFNTSYGLIPHDPKKFKKEVKRIGNKKLNKTLSARYKTPVEEDADDEDDE